MPSSSAAAGGATAAQRAGESGRSVLLLDRAGRIKPLWRGHSAAADSRLCHPRGAALCADSRGAHGGPSQRQVDMPINGGYVGMVNREQLDEYLRQRAALHGAVRRVGLFQAHRAR